MKVHSGGPIVGPLLEELGVEALTIEDTILLRDAAPAKAVVAHEVAHVAQSENGSGAAASSTPGDSSELEAERAGQAAARGEAPVVERGASGKAMPRGALSVFFGTIWRMITGEGSLSERGFDAMDESGLNKK